MGNDGKHSMKKLPLGIYTFSDIIKDANVYVDKTAIALDLLQSGRYYFLSRPRRFGKSLFLDTLKEVFNGNKELFKGLHIYNKWDFKDTSPVIKIDFAAGFQGPLERFDRKIRFALKEAERNLGIQIPNDDPAECLQELIWQAHEKHQKKVVILVDEYDKPILDNLLDKEKARSIRDAMKGFYAVIKQNDPYIRLAFITGVSQFS